MIDLRCYTCDARDPNCADCSGTGKREALQNGDGPVAAMRSATQAMRFVLRSDMIPGSFDETCECLESATETMALMIEARDALALVIASGTPNAMRLKQALSDAIGAKNFAALTNVGGSA